MQLRPHRTLSRACGPLGYAQFVVPLVRAVQEQQTQIEALQAKVAQLDALQAQNQTMQFKASQTDAALQALQAQVARLLSEGVQARKQLLQDGRLAIPPSSRAVIPASAALTAQTFPIPQPHFVP